VIGNLARMQLSSASSPADLAAMTSALPTIQDRVYLNAGTFGPMPQVAIDAMEAAAAREASDRYPHDMWERLDDAQVAARKRLASLVGASPEQVALMHTTHAGISTCMWGMDITPGDEIITTNEEHPGVLVPLRIMRDRRGARIRTVQWKSDPILLADAIAEQVTDRTVAVVLSHVSWVSGKVADLAAVRQRVGDNVLIIVDGAQGAGALPVDIGMGWDAYTVSGQKWTLGPSGSGALIVADPERWHPVMGGYFVTNDPHNPLDAPLQVTARRLEFSQESVVPLVGIAHALDFLTGTIGIARAHSHSVHLNAAARGILEPTLRRMHGASTPNNVMSGTAHLLICAVLPGTAPAITDHAASCGVSIRYLDDTHIRISLGAWNSEADVLELRAALESFAPCT
jgi:L-cysteine/cystine lyase